MEEKNLQKTIQEVIDKYEFTLEQVENDIVVFLQHKYLTSPKETLQGAIIQQAKERIVKTLFNVTQCEISQGWNDYSTIPSYKNLLIVLLSPAQRLFFDEIVNDLLNEELIYTKTYPGDNAPKAVGLTRKGILYAAEIDLYGTIL